MKHAFDYDVAVIGGGSGGYAAARTAAAAGLRTVVIEGGKEIGGLCILRGCMPTKALLYAAEVMHLARQSGTWGVRVKGLGFDFATVMERKNRLIKEFADFRTQQLTDGRFEFLRAEARFTDPHTVALSNGETLSAAHFIIATGSVVAPSPLPDLDEVGYLTSDSALLLQRLPKSLIVLGAGAVAVEFAQFFARFGVKVTVVQRSPQLVRDFDEDAAQELLHAFTREGIDVFSHTKLLGAAGLPGSKQIRFEHEQRIVSVEAEEIFFGLGRVPNIARLDLDRAIVTAPLETILTDRYMQTNVPHIYAIGDCAGPYEIVHIAVQQGELAAYNIAHPDAPRAMDYRLLTNIVFTEPQLATVGLTEREARLHNIPYRAASYPFRDHGKSMIMEALDGFVKLLAHPDSGEIIGGCCAGPVGGELIHEIVAAMHKRMTVHELATMPHYHPTLAEIWTYPAEALAEQIPTRA
jgi:pyruvate/2-oxoglutarate dehydrogenase complex dihydrolipoamide dehydrogenase (E3) component